MRLVCCSAVLLLFSSSALVAQSGGSPDPEFKGLIERYWQAWSSLDPDNAQPMYDRSADAVFFDVAPLRYDGWREYKEGVKKVFAGAVSAKFTPNEDLKATRHGDFAWTTETFKGTVQQRDGKSTELNGRHTTIWQKRNGKWLIVHEHVSVPLPS